MKTLPTVAGRVRFSLLFLGLAGGVSLGACAQTPQEGVVQVRFSDHREAIGDFSQFLVAIDSIELHLKDQPVDSAWIVLEPEVLQVDLTQLVGDQYEQVLEQRVASGDYDAVRVGLSGIHGVLSTGEDIILDDFLEIGRLEFRLEDGERAGLLVDLKVQSQHDHPGGAYILLLSEVREFQTSTE